VALGVLRVLLVAGLVVLAAAGANLLQTTFVVLVGTAILIGLLLEALSVRDAERGALRRLVQPPESPITWAPSVSPRQDGSSPR
jgi:hypothetical protein